MLKKIMNFFFEEEVIESEEYESEVIVDRGTKLTPISIDDTVTLEKAALKGNLEPIMTQKSEAKVEPKKDKSIFINDNYQDRYEKEEVIQADPTYDPNYHFSHVISPMFGVADKDKETDPTPQTLNVKKKKLPSGSRLGTIISPMYGPTNSDELVSDDLETVDETIIERINISEIIDSNQEESFSLDETMPFEEESLSTNEMPSFEEEKSPFSVSKAMEETKLFPHEEEEEEAPNLFNQDF